MKFKDKFRFVRQNMKKNRSRVYMTVLATAIGCSFLIVLASVGFGLQRSIISEISQGRTVTEINVHGKSTDDLKSYSQINDKDIAYLESVKNVKTVTRRQVTAQSLKYRVEGYENAGQAVVVDLPSEIKAGFELSAGRMPSADDEVVVGYNFHEFLTRPGEEPKPDKAPPSDSLLNKKVDMEAMQFTGKRKRENRSRSRSSASASRLRGNGSRTPTCISAKKRCWILRILPVPTEGC